MDGYNLRNGREWFCDGNEGMVLKKLHTPRLLIDTESPLSLRIFELEKILERMGPVTTFHPPPSPPQKNNSKNNIKNNPEINNFNRTKSLENLNFKEKRQLIGSSLSIAEILHQGRGH